MGTQFTAVGTHCRTRGLTQTLVSAKYIRGIPGMIMLILHKLDFLIFRRFTVFDQLLYHLSSPRHEGRVGQCSIYTTLHLAAYTWLPGMLPKVTCVASQRCCVCVHTADWTVLISAWLPICTWYNKVCRTLAWSHTCNRGKNGLSRQTCHAKFAPPPTIIRPPAEPKLYQKWFRLC